MKNNSPQPSRVRQIPQRTGTCVLCRHVATIVGFDHDLAPMHSGNGDLCTVCFCCARDAEDVLLNAGLVVPTDSILEGEN